MINESPCYIFCSLLSALSFFFVSLTSFRQKQFAKNYFAYKIPISLDRVWKECSTLFFSFQFLGNKFFFLISALTEVLRKIPLIL